MYIVVHNVYSLTFRYIQAFNIVVFRCISLILFLRLCVCLSDGSMTSVRKI